MALNSNENVREFQFDVILASEIIEHLSNPGLALKEIKNLIDPEKTLLITVPNANNLTTILYSTLLSKEYVNPNNTFWPSYPTFRKLLNRVQLNT